MGTNIFVSKPSKIRLAVSTVCQLSCPLCPTGRKEEMPIGRGFLKFSDFKKLIDGSPFVTAIELSNYGEIFLNPELGEIIKYAYLKGVELTAVNGSNLNTITEEMCELLVKYKFKNIVCSIDGASQEVYKIYRKGGDFNKVIDNINMINKYKRMYNSLLPFLKWQFVIFGHNVHEMEKAKNIARSLNMSFEPKGSWDPFFSPVQDKKAVKKAIGLDGLFFNYNLHKYFLCTLLWDFPQINWDGKLLGCCVNYWGDYGNVFHLGLEKAFNDEKIAYAREMLLGRAEGRKGIPCNSCYIYKEIKDRASFLTPLEMKVKNFLERHFKFHLVLFLLSCLGKFLSFFFSITFVFKNITNPIKKGHKKR